MRGGPSAAGGFARSRSEGDASSLQISGVSKVFRAADGAEVRALEGLSLAVAAGEMVSLIGPSGCGKSSLLRLIAGLDRPTSGELRVGADPITGPSAERGLMFQDPNLFPWLSVRRNIQAGLVARERSSPDRRQVVCRITPKGLDVLREIDVAMNAADDAAVSMLTAAQQRELVHLLDAVRAGHRQETGQQ